MGSGRQVLLLGRRMVINLNNKGGVRKSPGANKYAKCVGRERSNGKSFWDASQACKGKKG